MTDEKLTQAVSQPEATMKAVKLDRDGNVVQEIEFDNVETRVSPGFLKQLQEAARQGWNEGKQK